MQSHSESASDSSSSSESDSDFEGAISHRDDTKPDVPPGVNGGGVAKEEETAEMSSEDHISFSYSSDDDFLPSMMKKKRTATPTIPKATPTIPKATPTVSSAKKNHEAIRNKLSAHKSSVDPKTLDGPALSDSLLMRPKSEGVSTLHDMSPTTSMHGRHSQPTPGSGSGSGHLSDDGEDMVASPSSSPRSSHQFAPQQRVYESRKKEDLLSIEKKRRRLSFMNTARKPAGSGAGTNTNIEVKVEEDTSGFPPKSGTSNGQVQQPELSWPQRMHMMKHRGKISAMAGYNKSSSLSPSPNLVQMKGGSTVLSRTSSSQSVGSNAGSVAAAESLDRSIAARSISPRTTTASPHRGKIMPMHKKHHGSGSLSSASSDSKSDSEEVSSRKPAKSKLVKSKSKPQSKTTKYTESIPLPPKKRGRPSKSKEKQSKESSKVSKSIKPAKKPVVEMSESEDNAHVSEMEEEEEVSIEPMKAARIPLPSSTTATSVLSSSLDLGSKPDTGNDTKNLELAAKDSFRGSIWADSGYLKSSSSEKSESSSSGSESDANSHHIKAKKLVKHSSSRAKRVQVDSDESSDEEVVSSRRRSPLLNRREPSPALPSTKQSSTKTKDKKPSENAKASSLAESVQSHSSSKSKPKDRTQNSSHNSRPHSAHDSSREKKSSSKKKKAKSSHQARARSPSPSPSPSPQRPSKVTPFTAAKLPGSTETKLEEKPSGNRSEKLETSSSKDTKKSSTKRKKNIISSDSDSESGSADERFANFLKTTSSAHAQAKAKRANVSPAPPKLVSNSEAVSAKEEKAVKAEKSQSKKGKSSGKDAKSSASGSKPASSSGKSTTSGPASANSRKRPLEKDDAMDGLSSDKKLRLVDIDFTGGKMKKAQQQQQQTAQKGTTSKTSKLSRLQKLRMQSQKLHHGSLQHTSHAFTIASIKNTGYSSNASPPKNQKASLEKANPSPVKNPDAGKKSSVPTTKSPSKDKEKTKLDLTNRERTRSPLVTSAKHDLTSSFQKSSSAAAMQNSRARGESPSKSSSGRAEDRPRLKEGRKSEPVSLEKPSMSAKPSVHVESASVTGSGNMWSSSSASASKSAPKIIQGENKYYSPFRSMGKMMPLMNDDRSDSPVRSSSKERKKHHNRHHNSERESSQSYKDFDGGAEDSGSFSKDAILAAKFPQMRNRVPPSTAVGAATTGSSHRSGTPTSSSHKGGASSHRSGGSSSSKHHRDYHKSDHGRTNRTGGIL